MDYGSHFTEKDNDKIPTNGYTRYDSKFDTIKHDQSTLAENKISEICSACYDDPFGEIDDIFFYNFHMTFDKLDDLEIQSNMAFESERAQKIMASILDPLLYHK